VVTRGNDEVKQCNTGVRELKAGDNRQPPVNRGGVDMTSDPETNKKIAAEFFDLIFNKGDFESARKYMGLYKQHNPLVADGPEGLRVYVAYRKSIFPGSRSEIKRIIAEGDYVVLHVHTIRSPKVQRATIEIFRLENGKIEEHWDVGQEVPETLAHGNGMF
jgi:predicted SnoaL-like aldol condensation-catalyzing enzyme